MSFTETFTFSPTWSIYNNSYDADRYNGARAELHFDFTTGGNTASRFVDQYPDQNTVVTPSLDVSSLPAGFSLTEASITFKYVAPYDDYDVFSYRGLSPDTFASITFPLTKGFDTMVVGMGLSDLQDNMLNVCISVPDSHLGHGITLKSVSLFIRGNAPEPEPEQTPVPEPGSLALLGLGLAGIALFRRGATR